MDIYDIRQVLQGGKTIYDLPIKVTFYARVSTDKDEQIHSIKSQVDYFINHIKGCENWIFIDGYIDEGLSGTSVTKRENFLRMIEDAHRGKFDFIVTKEISRFSRNTIDSIKFTQELLQCGVGVYFQSDNLNTLMPDSELRLTIMSSLAQDEVRKTSERVKFGFQQSISKGVVLGSNRIWGYKKDNGRLVIIPEEAKMVKQIFYLYAMERLGMKRICDWLKENGYKNSAGNDFSFSSIKGILTNPKYKGYYCGNKTRKYDYKLSDVKYLNQADWVMYKDETGLTVPAIVSEEIWDTANIILAKRGEKQSTEDTTTYSNRYTYSSKIICAEHKLPYYRANYKYASGNREVWQCKRYVEQGKRGCESPTVYTDELNEVMKQSLDLIVENKADIIHEMVTLYSDLMSKSKIKEDIASLKVKVNDTLRMKDKLLELSLNGRISDDEFESRNERFNQTIEEYKQGIEDLATQEMRNKEMMQSVEALRGLIANELDFNNGLDINLTDRLLEKIEVYKTDDKDALQLKVYLKVIDERLPFMLARHKGKQTSVVYTPYT